MATIEELEELAEKELKKLENKEPEEIRQKVPSKPLTSETVEKFNEQKILQDKKNQYLQLPIEELLKLLGLSDEEIVLIGDEDLDVLCDELSGSKSTRLRTKIKMYKKKLRQENPPPLTPHEKYLINLPVEDLVIYKKMGDFWKQSDHVQEMINKKIKEEERLLREYVEREELQRQLIEKEEADKIEKARLKKLAICPYCNKQVINKKELNNNISVTCPECGGEVQNCGLCNKVVTYPKHDCEFLNAFKR